MDTQNHQEEKKKGFFTKLVKKLDKKLEAKAQKTGSCCGSKDHNGADFPSFQNKGNQCRPSRPSQKESKNLDGPNADQSKPSGDWGRPNHPCGKKIKGLGGDSCCG